MRFEEIKRCALALNGSSSFERLLVAAILAAVVAIPFGEKAYAQLGAPALETTRVSQVTGAEDRSVPGKLTGAQQSGVTGGVTGTDLGFTFESNDKLYFLFGDSREFHPDLGEPDLVGTLEPNKALAVCQPNPEKLQRWDARQQWDDFVRVSGGEGRDSIATAPLSFDPDQGIPVRFETRRIGAVFAHDVAANTIGLPVELTGAEVATNAQDKWVLVMGNRILVITTDGRVFAHDIVDTNVGVPFQLGGARVAANPQDKWVLVMGNRILVITNGGGVFAHDVTGNTIGVPFQLSGQQVAARPEDKWVLAMGGRILVVTRDGRVFAHAISGNNNIGTPFQLVSPKLGANPRDKLVLAGDNSLLVLTRQDGIFRPTLLNGSPVHRREGATTAFTDNSVLYAFWTLRDDAGHAHDDPDFGGIAVLSKSVDGGRTFVETSLVSQTKFLWTVPVVEQSANLRGLPEGMTEQIVLLWGSGREKNDRRQNVTPWNYSYPFLAIAPLSSMGVEGGSVSVHEITGNTIGAPFQLGEPRVPPNPEDRRFRVMGDRLLVMGNRLLVLMKDGRVFAQEITGNGLGVPMVLNGPRVAANPQDKRVLIMGNRILVVTEDGQIFAHEMTENTIGVPFQLGGARVAANPQDKWVLVMGNRILVVANDGRVFAHDITGDTIGVPFQLGGPKVAANPQDKHVLVMGNRILVVTQGGQCFVHDITGNTIGAPFQLGGPQVAARPEDKWVLAMGGRILVVTRPPWRYYGGVTAQGQPIWKEDEALAQPLPPFGSSQFGAGFHKSLGYYSVRFIEGWRKWTMLYTCNDDASAGYNKDNGPRGVYLRTADVPWGPWSAPRLILKAADAYCAFMHNQAADFNNDCKNKGVNPVEESVRGNVPLERIGACPKGATTRGWGGEYAPLLLPSRYARVQGNQMTLYFLMSTWNPYQVILMRTVLTSQ
jgi:hypothetical protein